MTDRMDEFKEKSEELKQKAQDTAQEIQEEAKDAYQNVREEAKEVIEEAKAAISGQKLDSTDTVGGAGYRADNSTSSTTAVISLVLGIVSIVCSFFGYGAILGLVLGIVGTVLGAKARKESQTGLATGGFVCSILGLIFNALGLVCAIACAGTLAMLSQMS